MIQSQVVRAEPTEASIVFLKKFFCMYYISQSKSNRMWFTKKSEKHNEK